MVNGQQVPMRQKHQEDSYFVGGDSVGYWTKRLNMYMGYLTHRECSTVTQNFVLMSQSEDYKNFMVTVCGDPMPTLLALRCSSLTSLKPNT